MGKGKPIMAILKIFIVLGLIFFGIYYIIEGYKRGKKDGFHFNITDLFKNIAFPLASGSTLIVEGLFALLVALLCYIKL